MIPVKQLSKRLLVTFRSHLLQQIIIMVGAGVHAIKNSKSAGIQRGESKRNEFELLVTSNMSTLFEPGCVDRRESRSKKPGLLF